MGDRFQDDSRGPLVNMFTWFFMVVNILAVLARIGAKFRLFHKMKSDDWLIIISMISAVIECICVSMAIRSGYGNHSHSISHAESIVIMKYLYSGYIFFIASLSLSKLSLSTLIRNLTMITEQLRFAKVIRVAIGLWTAIALIGAIFGAALQCGITRIWIIWAAEYSDLETWRCLICIMNILTDLFITAQGLIIAYQIQANLKKRMLVGIVFLSRILVTGGIIAELIFTIRVFNSSDPAYNFCLVTIFEGLVQCLSIVTACQGQLKPFITWMEPKRHQVHDQTQNSLENGTSIFHIPLLAVPRATY